ncbi:hypothetical protein K0U83_17490 [bacterium]|nr:hypothetical protein [bacterium]
MSALCHLCHAPAVNPAAIELRCSACLARDVPAGPCDSCGCHASDPYRRGHRDGFEAALTLFWQDVCLERAAILTRVRVSVEREAAAEREWLKPSARGIWQDTLDNYDREIAKLLALGGAR